MTCPYCEGASTFPATYPAMVGYHVCNGCGWAFKPAENRK